MFGGSFYLWANISVYVLSYFKYQKTDNDVSENSIYRVDIVLSVLNILGYLCGSYLLN